MVAGGSESYTEDGIKPGGLYDGPVRMAIMEYTEGNTADKEPTWPEDAREQTKKAVRTLHDAQLVRGHPMLCFHGARCPP